MKMEGNDDEDWRRERERGMVTLIAAAAANKNDVSDLSSLRQLKDLLSSSWAPQLIDLASSSPQPPLLQVVEEIGLRDLEQSSQLMPFLLALLKDEDPGVVRQSLNSGMKFFSAVLDDLVRQFHQHGRVDRWVEEMWVQIIEFKDTALSLVLESVSVGTRLVALKFLENFVLIFTQDAADSDRMILGGTRSKFNMSLLVSSHPVLDAVKLRSEANRLLGCFLDMLQSSSRIPGPLTLAVVN